MWKIIALAGVTTLGLIWGYGFVSGWNLIFNPEVRFATSVSDTVYMDSNDVNTAVVVYQSNVDLKNAYITSLCDVNSRFLTQSKGLYFFEVNYSQDPTCENGNIVLSLGEDDYANTIHELELTSDIDIYSRYLDYSSEKLREYQKVLISDIAQNAIYKNFDRENIVKYYTYFVGQKKYQNALYKNTIINKILTAREKPYSVPVLGKEISTLSSRLPNTGRPYREHYTDGIHHGWDVYGDYGENVIALDDAVVVRIVDWFDDGDFSRIVYGDNLSLEQELKNLDILRGNQVWLKSMKGDVAFYSHLSFIESDIKEGDIIERGTILGKIGISGVPDSNYTDYHLHFAVMQNPYNYLEAGSYDFGEYMAWNWLTRWQNHDETLHNSNIIFE